jgi:DNA invertase Pin-like site-specific DNA recombinase
MSLTMIKAKRAAIYVRVSTDRQTVENQIPALRGIAERRGWDVVEVYNDAGISGSKGRNERPGLDQMLKDASKGKFNVVMVWAIDRLGRSLLDLLGTIQHLKECNADVYIDQQNLDTTTPTGKLMFQVCGAFAEFERSMIVTRIHAGLDRAKTQGRVGGRPKLNASTKAAIMASLANGASMRKAERDHGVGSGTVRRIAAEMKAG